MGCTWMKRSTSELILFSTYGDELTVWHLQHLQHAPLQIEPNIDIVYDIQQIIIK